MSASAQLAKQRQLQLHESNAGEQLQESINREEDSLLDDYLYEIPEELKQDENFQEIYQKFESLHPVPAPESYVDKYNQENDTDHALTEENEKQTEEDSNIEEETEEETVSKKKARKLYRMTVAQLKSLVQRPEVVEVS